MFQGSPRKENVAIAASPVPSLIPVNNGVNPVPPGVGTSGDELIRQNGSNLMGVLQCRVKSSMSLESITGYKKRFVLLNVTQQALYIYKNDQSLSPLMTFRADRLRSVHYAAEKHSRFFQVIIRTHTREQIRLLFETWNERDRWGRAITQMLDHFDSFNRRHSTIQLVERLCEGGRRKLNVDVSVTHEHFLENVPDALLQHVPEAVEKAIETIRDVVSRGALSRPPAAYHIDIVVSGANGETPAHQAGVQYDPSSRCAVIHVQMAFQAAGDSRLNIIVPPYSNVESIVQSRVYRNPVIERWLDPEENKSEAFQRIRKLLPSLSSSSASYVSFQWDQRSDMLQSKQVQNYVQNFICDSFFESLAEEIDLGLRMLSRDLLSPLLSRDSSPLVHLQTFEENPAHYLLQDCISGIAIPIDYEAVKALQCPQVLLTKTVNYNEKCRSAFLLNAIFSNARTRRGTGVYSQSDVFINTHTQGNTTSVPGLVRVSKNSTVPAQLGTSDGGSSATKNTTLDLHSSGPLNQQISSPSFKEDDHIPSISNQILRVGANVLLSFYLRAYKDVLRAAARPFDVSVNWSDLFQAYAILTHSSDSPDVVVGGGDGTFRRGSTTANSFSSSSVFSSHLLLFVVQDVVEGYRRRIEQTMKSLRSRKFKPANDEDKPLLSVMERYVRCISVDFSVLCGDQGLAGANRGFASLAPSVRRGVLRDVMICGGKDSFAGAESALFSTPFSSSNMDDSREPVVQFEISEVTVSAAAPDLSDWCAKFFAKGIEQGLLEEVSANADVEVDDLFTKEEQEWRKQRRHHGPHHNNRFRKSVFVDDDEDSLDDGDRIGDSVAIVRRDEVERIPLHQVRTTVYDSQGEDVRLKIGLEDITMAVNSLKTAVPGLSMFLHDAMGILMVNLNRLRDMFGKQLHSTNDIHKFPQSAASSASRLTLLQAVNLLKDYCEYEESSECVEEVCCMFCRLRRPERLISLSAHLPLSVILWNLCALEREYGIHNSTGGNSLYPSSGNHFGAEAKSCYSPMTTTPTGANPLGFPAKGNNCQNNVGDEMAPEKSKPPSTVDVPPISSSRRSSIISHTENNAASNVQIDSDNRNQPQKQDEKIIATCGIGRKTSKEVGGATLVNSGVQPFDQSLTTGDRPNGQGSSNAGVSIKSSTTETREMKLLKHVYSECIDFRHSRVSVDARNFDFPIIADIALNLLLPKEVAASQRARRVGLLFGLDRTGKTLISNCLRGCVRPTVATVGMKEHIISFQQWILVMHELGGRECFRRNWIHYVQRAPPMTFLMFVIDAQNRVNFEESRKYLHEVLSHFPSIPLLVVFNNYPQMELMDRIHKPIDELERRFRIPAIRAKEPDRCVLVLTCDVTLVHSTNRSVPYALLEALDKLSHQFVRTTPANETPSMPKCSEKHGFVTLEEPEHIRSYEVQRRRKT